MHSLLKSSEYDLAKEHNQNLLCVDLNRKLGKIAVLFNSTHEWAISSVVWFFVLFLLPVSSCSSYGLNFLLFYPKGIPQPPFWGEILLRYIVPSVHIKRWNSIYKNIAHTDQTAHISNLISVYTVWIVISIHFFLRCQAFNKSVYQKINFLISQPKHMLWVLKRTFSMRRFFWAHKTYAKTDW